MLDCIFVKDVGTEVRKTWACIAHNVKIRLTINALVTIIFTVRYYSMHCERCLILTIAKVSVCLSVYLFVTLCNSTKTTEDKITKYSLSVSRKTVVSKSLDILIFAGIW